MSAVATQRRHAADEVVAQLATHRPADAAERVSLRRTRRLLAWLPSPLAEHADPTHVTGSAIVLGEDGRILLHRHKRLGRWLQPGGHLDPGERPWEAAARETREETGLTATHPAGGPTLLHVDVHEGPRGHVHLDLRYLLLGDPRSPLAPAAGESPVVAWWDPPRVQEHGDPSLVAALRAAMEHAARP